MKRILVLAILISCCSVVFARHGKGGYLIYQYLGDGIRQGTSKYRITVLHYVNCQEVQFETGFVYIGIFDALNYGYQQTITISTPMSQPIRKQSFDPCINPVPEICFYQFNYSTTIELANNTNGYILTEQECCRAQSILNEVNSGATGSTNTNTIPGIINGVSYRNNSSPVPALKDTAVICHNSYFQIDFGSTDPDGDVLSYSFCNAEAGGSRQDRQPNPPSPPPYTTIDYTPGYSGSSPLGKKVTIDEKTGLISGVAPAATGQYVIAVCINELRNGIKIGNTKKEVLVTVADCNLTAAVLKPSYINCDSFSVQFQNESLASNVSAYSWDFGVPGQTEDISTDPTPLYTYPVAGTYTVKLKVLSDAGCSDTTSATVKIYPGFKPDFTASGSCYQSPFLFMDKTFAAYGTVDSWAWNFGDAASANNTSSVQNPTHLFTAPNNTTVTFTVATSVGCADTLTKAIAVNNKPRIQLPFTDTLICNGDLLPLDIESSGDSYTWTPDYRISDAAIRNPVVQPSDSVVYKIVVRDKTCIDSARLRVNVLDFITIRLPADTAICATDSIIFKPVSDALKYTWSESGNTTLSSTNIKNPVAAPIQNTTYYVTAMLGHCQDQTQTNVLVSPYPVGNAGSDVTICYGSTVPLKGSTTAAFYNWEPPGSLLNANTLTPLAGPQATTAYLLVVRDSFYCPKSTADTVVVTVTPPVQVNAGNDTIVVINQPLQLHAAGDEDIISYNWQPSSWLNDSRSASPVATIFSTYANTITYAVKATTSQGCSGTDSMTVFVYKTLPEIYIPTAFTPNGDGLNDIFKPVVAGIRQFDYFRIYNRLGQLLYATTLAGKGWDGTLKGIKQPAGTYVFTALGKDYTGHVIEKKGTLVLIR